MGRTRTACALLLLGVTALASPAAAQELFTDLTLPIVDDTWATHDDGLVHGAEEILRVGIEPQGCNPPGYDPCPGIDMVCCVAASGANFCAPEVFTASTALSSQLPLSDGG